MIEKQVLVNLLNNEFYVKTKGSVTKEIFPGDLGRLYETLGVAHEKYSRDFSVEEIFQLHLNLNPAITLAAKSNLEFLIEDLKKVEPIKEDLAADLVLDMSKR